MLREYRDMLREYRDMLREYRGMLREVLWYTPRTSRYEISGYAFEQDYKVVKDIIDES